MSQMGQPLPKFDVPVRSAVRAKAAAAVTIWAALLLAKRRLVNEARTRKAGPSVRNKSFRGFERKQGVMVKYMLSWTERPQGSPVEYENAQKRILEVFTQWKAPGNFKIELFVIRVGDWGGYMLLDCDDPAAVHKFCSMLPAFVFEARPVIPIEDAVKVELEAIAFRDGLKRQ
jgi:muconolactone delta-isomerase